MELTVSRGVLPLVAYVEDMINRSGIVETVGPSGFVPITDAGRLVPSSRLKSENPDRNLETLEAVIEVLHRPQDSKTPRPQDLKTPRPQDLIPSSPNQSAGAI